MIRAMRLMGAGALPLFLGFLLDRLLLAFPASGMVRVPLSVLLLFAWGYFAFRLSDSLQNAVLQAFLLCAFGLLMLALTLYQELVMGSYWGNILGYGTQMFFFRGFRLRPLWRRLLQISSGYGRCISSSGPACSSRAALDAFENSTGSLRRLKPGKKWR